MEVVQKMNKRTPAATLLDPKIVMPAIGSAFAGLSANTLFYNLSGAMAMAIGRFWMIIPTMIIAGSLASKKLVPASAGTFPTTGGLFVGLVVGVIVIVGGLTFFPALALGPIAEQLALNAGTLFSSN